MADKKPSTSASKNDKKASFKKVFFGVMFLIICLAGFFAGRFIQGYFFEGQYIEGGIGNTTKAKLIFYPNEIALEAIIQLINSAEEEIIILTTSITSRAVIDALAAKVQSGVRVAIIFNPVDVAADNQGDNSPLVYLYRQGVRELYKDSIVSTQQTIAIDSRYLMVGNGQISTKAAANTSATFVFFDSKELALRFRKYFTERYQASTRVYQ